MKSDSFKFMDFPCSAELSYICIAPRLLLRIVDVQEKNCDATIISVVFELVRMEQEMDRDEAQNTCFTNKNVFLGFLGEDDGIIGLEGTWFDRWALHSNIKARKEIKKIETSNQ